MTTALDLVGLVKEFPVRGAGSGAQVVHAVSDVSLRVEQHETVGLVGESGCGKSSLARCSVRLTDPTAGSVQVLGTDLLALKGRELRHARKQIQMVFQDPFTTLDPRMSVAAILREPMEIHGLHRRRRADAVRELMARVDLNPDHVNRYPHQFSGGQRQRIGLARALAVDPRIVVLDEPLSALDVSVQSGVLNLLEDLQRDLGLSYLLIAHDLSVVRHISTVVAVMYLGRVVEQGPVDAVYDSAQHPYTQALLSAAPVPDPNTERSRKRIVLAGDVPSPINPPSGCRFRTRCWRATQICVDITPQLVDAGGGHQVACHHPGPVGGTADRSRQKTSPEDV